MYNLSFIPTVRNNHKEFLSQLKTQNQIRKNKTARKFYTRLQFTGGKKLTLWLNLSVLTVQLHLCIS